MITFVASEDNDLALGVGALNGKKYLMLERDEVIAGTAKLFRRFQFFEGEWFLDTRQGTPYVRYVFVKNPDFAILRRLFQQLIMSVGVMARVTVIDFTFTPETRGLDFYFEAVASDGRKVSGGLSKPFIIDGKSIGVPVGDETR